MAQSLTIKVFAAAVVGAIIFYTAWLAGLIPRPPVAPVRSATVRGSSAEAVEMLLGSITGQAFGDRSVFPSAGEVVRRLELLEGQSLRKLSINQLGDQPMPQLPGFWVGSDGQIVAQLGASVDAQGSQVLQLLDRGSPRLVPPSSLIASGLTNFYYAPAGAASRVICQSGPLRVGFDKLFWNFGLVEPHGKGRLEFVVSNAGDSAFRVDRTVVSCGCIDLDEGLALPVEIHPGESVRIAAKVNFGRSESLAQSVLIAVSDGSQEAFSKRLPIFASQRRGAYWSPSQINLGSIASGSKMKLKALLTISETKSDQFSIEDIVCIPPSVLSVEPVGHQSGQYEVRLNAQGLATGAGSGEVSFHTTSTMTPEIKVPVLWLVKSQIQVFPARFAFGLVRKDDIRRSIAKVLVKSDAELVAVEVISSPSFLEISYDPALHQVSALVTSIAPTSLDGTVRLNCVTLDGSKHEVSLPVSGLLKL